MSVHKFKPRPRRLECSSCGAEGTGNCECGVPYVAAGTRAAAAIAKNPEMSDRAIADQLGVNKSTVNRARKSGGAYEPPETRTGKDGKKYPVKKPKLKVVPDDDLPSEEEAEESWQEAVYDQACLLLERMADATRRRFFAHIKRKHRDEI